MTNTQVAILTGCESDIHLSQQICTELSKLDISPTYIDLTQNNIIDSYHKANYCFKKSKYNFVLAVGDRTEQVGGVLAAFQNKIPIGHLYAGDYNTISTFDDKHRHVITLYSDIQFCSCPESFEHTGKLMYTAGLTPNPYCVGATHFDNINIADIDISCRYRNNGKYLLVSLNSETLGNNEKMLEETVSKIKQSGIKTIYLTEGNTDDTLYSIEIKKILIKLINDESYTILNMERLDHEYYLYLILHCAEYITNSSSAIYEAPYLISQNKVHIVGNRNKNRTKIPKESHNGNASKKVAELIKQFLESKT